MHTYLSPEHRLKYSWQLVPGAPPGGGYGDIGPAHLAQAGFPKKPPLRKIIYFY